MPRLKWNNGEPPHKGWWRVTLDRSANPRAGQHKYWGWWDGVKWSSFANQSYSAKDAAIMGNSHGWGDTNDISWCDTYPAYARVPRIDPDEWHLNVGVQPAADNVKIECMLFDGCSGINPASVWDWKLPKGDLGRAKTPFAIYAWRVAKRVAKKPQTR